MEKITQDIDQYPLFDRLSQRLVEDGIIKEHEVPDLLSIYQEGKRMYDNERDRERVRNYIIEETAARFDTSIDPLVVPMEYGFRENFPHYFQELTY